MATHDLKREPNFSTPTPHKPEDPDHTPARPHDDLPNPTVPNPEAHATHVPTRQLQAPEGAHPHVQQLADEGREHIFLVSDDGRLAASGFVEATFGLASREGVPYLKVRLTGYEALPDDAPANRGRDDRPREVRQHEDARQEHED